MTGLFKRLAFALGILAVPLGVAHGAPLGPDPTLVFEGPVGFSATADTLLECAGTACDIGGGIPGLGGAGGLNCNGRNRSTVRMDNIPVSDTLRILHARLNWVASTPANQVPDNEVSITPPGGQAIMVEANPEISEAFQDGAPPNDCAIASMICGGNIACDLGFYSNHADITQQIQAHMAGGGNVNGDWTFGDVTIPGARGDDPATAIAALGSLTIGAWSLIIVYEDAANLPTRRLYYYQGFELNSGVDRQLFPTGFRAPPDPEVDLALMVLEGDLDIQGDGLSVNGRQVSDGCNPVNNLFNGTVNTGTVEGRCRQGVTGVDLDRFLIRNAIQPGDIEAEIVLRIPRGDGLLTPGEQLFTNWMILQFDHLLPDFDAFKPEKEASPPNGSEVRPGEEIIYRIKVQNRGAAAARNVTLTDQVPRGTTYVAGSSRLDQMAFPDDNGGGMPLNGGLLLTDLAQIGDTIDIGEQHFFEFTVRVNNDVEHGFQITNIARISADLVDDLRTDPVVHLVRTTDGGLPDPILDLGMIPTPDMGDDSDSSGVTPVADGGAPVGDGPLVLGRDMMPDGPPPECGEGLRYDPHCEPMAGCVPESRPPCDRFCPDPPQPGLVPVECNSGLASTACAEGRTCARISLEDSTLYGCVPDDLVPYPACRSDADCVGDTACFQGICLRVCPASNLGGEGGSSDGCDCDSTQGSSSSVVWALLIGLLAIRRRTWC